MGYPGIVAPELHKVKKLAQDVAAAGTPEALTASKALASTFLIRAKSANTGNVYVGLSDLDTTDADTVLAVLAAGYSQSRTAQPGHVFNIADYYIDVDVNGEGVIVEYAES